MGRMTFARAEKILKDHYGTDRIAQIWKPDGKKFYIVTFKDERGEISTTERFDYAKILSLA